MKKVILLVAVLMLTLALLAACGKTQTAQPTTPATQAATEAATQPTQPQTEATEAEPQFEPFVGMSWTRDAENDIETIRFGEDGSFSYSCACGNPVNDSDLCEGYTYDEATKTITLDCIETTEEMVVAIKVVSCDGAELKLDFNGDIRVFTKE